MTRCLTILAAIAELTLLDAAEPPSYVREIQPLLAERCVKCHGAEKQKGGLRLDHRAVAFRGGDSGEPGINPRQRRPKRIVPVGVVEGRG
jgi:hypothetical protein